MEILNAIFQGIIQGLTEFLPISSSGHLALYQFFSGSKGDDGTLLAVLLHLGTLLAVFVVYYKTIFELIVEFIEMIKDVFCRRFTMKKMSDNRRMIIMLMIACIPLLLLLLPVGGDKKLMDVLSGFSVDNNLLSEGLSFLFTAGLLIMGSRVAMMQKDTHKINTTDALAVGFSQFLAAGFAGISRSGSTISTGMLCGVSKEYMVKFSFILGIPAILAANVMEIKDAVSGNSSVNIVAAVIGIAVAAFVGVLAIKALQWIIKKDMFKYFGYYCLSIGTIATIIGIVQIIKK